MFVLAVAAVALVQVSTRYRKKAEFQAQDVIAVNRIQLEVRSGQFYRPGSTIPFTGWMLDHFPDGKVSLRSAVVNGRLEGMSEGWFTNGVRQIQEHFRHGLPEGIRRTWHGNGRKRSEGHLLSGLQHGLYRLWDDQGNLLVEAEFADGKAHGLSLAWYPSGFLQAEAMMRHGEIQSRHNYVDKVQSQPTLHREPQKSASLTSTQ
jgi:antitoxin component YwqK of YwqJK toxin-antitoxin module